jgi:hypothetical protein
MTLTGRGDAVEQRPPAPTAETRTKLGPDKSKTPLPFGNGVSNFDI